MIGYIYIMETPYDGLLKVGLTNRDINKREKELSGQTGVLGTFKIIHYYEVPAVLTDIIERRAHKYLKERNLHHDKEYFRADEIQCRDAIEVAIEQTNANEMLLEIKQQISNKVASYTKEAESKKIALRTAFASENRILVTQIEQSFKEFEDCVNSIQEKRAKISRIKFLFFSDEVNELQDRKARAGKILDLSKPKYEQAVRNFQQTHRLKRVPLLETIGKYESIFYEYKRFKKFGW